jgi:hypothetical protein
VQLHLGAIGATASGCKQIGVSSQYCILFYRFWGCVRRLGCASDMPGGVSDGVVTVNEGSFDARESFDGVL